jgi:hypothetical protein
MQRGKIILAAVLALATLGANSTGYHVFKKVALPGAGGWDYLTVDEAARRLYVSHATQVVVLDAGSLEIVGKIPDLPGFMELPSPRNLAGGSLPQDKLIE